ncbi:MAG: tRNA preQ1(34) S-adenosylmethionine ribosyltransferase-isomerase QueA [Burkholderiaceae bacterium]|jgi:S-adenosylmethionine:tRNA ribosyltransferase-isomerase|nr:tRNA preQ1(34) S-adenosylmethionine ribosyltransferase-isomerase QueA [Burkholderiaceae bacterium]
MLTTSDFDYALPSELIAQHPAAERGAARLLDGSGPAPVDRVFGDLPGLLTPADLLVFNDTQVVKARLYGQKPGGGRLELLIERVLADGSVAAHMKASRKPRAGALLRMDGGFTAELLGRWPDAHGPLFHLRLAGDAYALMAAHGHVPLPPYIARADGAEDEARYQSVFARVPGAVAAPTAALHFDAALLARLDARGVRRAAVTLHVGAGTFQPVKTERIDEHVMHRERYAVPAATQAAIADCRTRGGRVVAVGTTCVRTLESWAQSGQAAGETGIFITPGFEFRVVHALITNFHLPRSTLLMLVSAFAGHERVMQLYRHAIAARYRFFSYGDAMWLTRGAFLSPAQEPL